MSLEVKGFVVAADALLGALVPEAIGIVSIEGEHLAEGHRRGELGPAGAGVEGEVETYGEGYALQRQQVLGRTAVFVVELGRDDGTAVFPLQALHLGEDLAIEAGGVSKEGAVLRTHLAAFGKEPVGQTAVAHFAVAPRTHAQHDGQSLGLADLKETA